MNQDNGILHRKVTINSISNVGKFLVFVGVAFLITPFLIRRLGNSQYGLWVLILSFIGYAGILEMGVQTAVVKLVAEYKASGQEDRLNGVVSTALALFAGIGVALALTAWLALPLLLDKIVKDPSQTEIALRLVLVLAVNLCVMFPSYIFSGVVYGLQYYHLKNVIDIVVCIANGIALYALLGRGYGIFAVAVVKTVTDFVGLAMVVILCRSVHRTLSIRLRNVSRAALRELLVIGGKIFSSATMARVANNAEPIIITTLLSTAWTAIFSIPRRLVDYAKEISWAMTAGFMPMFSDLHGRSDHGAILDMYVRYTRYVLLCILPLLTMIAVFGGGFIKIWIGVEYYEGGRILLYLLAIAFYVESMQPLIWRLFIGIGDLDILVKIASATSAGYIVLAFLLTRFWGINGMGIALVGTTLVSQAIFFARVSRQFEVSMPELFRRTQFAPVACSLAYGAFVYAVQRLIVPGSYAAIAAQILSTFPVYLMAAYMFALDSREKEFVRLKIGSAIRQVSWEKR